MTAPAFSTTTRRAPGLADTFVPPVLPADAAARYQALCDALGPDEEVPVPDVIPIDERANEYQMLTMRELRELAASIAERGQRQPCTMHEGKLIDGRNRLAACLLRGLAARFEPWRGESGTVEAFIEDMNEHRRHLAPSVRAAIAAGRVKRFRGAGDGPSPGGKSVELAARSVPGAGLTATKFFDYADRRDPELRQLGVQGKINAEEAKRLADLAPAERETAKERIKAGEDPRDVAPPTKTRRRAGPIEPLVLTSPSPRSEPAEPEDPRALRDVVVALDHFRLVETNLQQITDGLSGHRANQGARGAAVKLLREVRAEMAALQRRVDGASYLQVGCPSCMRPAGAWCVRPSGGYAALHPERLKESERPAAGGDAR